MKWKRQATRLSIRKWIIGLGPIVLVATLLFLGSFFIYWGGWNYVFGSRIGLFFGVPMGLFGGCIVFVGIMVVMNMTKLRERMRVIALGVSSLYVGSFFIYFGLRAYLFPRFPVDIYNAPLGMNFGTIMMIIGILLFLSDFIFKKRK